MTAPEDLRRVAAEYVLGTLSPADRREAQARAEQDEAFADLVRLWERRFAPLHELSVPARPPDGLWDDIFAALPPPPPVPAEATESVAATDAGSGLDPLSDEASAAAVPAASDGRAPEDGALARSGEATPPADGIPPRDEAGDPATAPSASAAFDPAAGDAAPYAVAEPVPAPIPEPDAVAVPLRAAAGQEQGPSAPGDAGEDAGAAPRADAEPADGIGLNAAERAAAVSLSGQVPADATPAPQAEVPVWTDEASADDAPALDEAAGALGSVAALEAGERRSPQSFSEGRPTEAEVLRPAEASAPSASADLDAHLVRAMARELDLFPARPGDVGFVPPVAPVEHRDGRADTGLAGSEKSSPMVEIVPAEPLPNLDSNAARAAPDISIGRADADAHGFRPENLPLEPSEHRPRGPDRRWQVAAGLLALVVLLLGTAILYRESRVAPPARHVAVLEQGRSASISIALAPETGDIIVQRMDEPPGEGLIYRLWLVSHGLGTQALCVFAAAGRVHSPVLAGISPENLLDAQLQVTLEPISATGTVPTGKVVYFGRVLTP